MIERIEKRLVGRKDEYLSKGGKLILLKSVLSSFPIFYLSLFLAPASITNKIENVQREFL